MSCQALFRCCRTRANQFFYQLSLKTFIFLQIIALSKCIWHSKYQFQFVFHCQIKQIFYKQFQNYLLIFCVICFLHTKLSSSVYRVIFNNVTLALSLQNVYLDCIKIYNFHTIRFNSRKSTKYYGNILWYKKFIIYSISLPILIAKLRNIQYFWTPETKHA